jgi:hypothetical protein
LKEEHPKFVYKYRPIENLADLKSDYYLDALFNNYAVFSSRKNFNDLFDSKIDLINPSPKEVKEYINTLPKSKRSQSLIHLNKGKFTPEGEVFLAEVKKRFNEKVDTYAFMSLSAIPDSNLMWSHYAKSHTGFCIEYRTEYVTARKVTYSSDLPTINLIDLYKEYHEPSIDKNLGDRILDALLCKLKEWEYECEYRFIAGMRLASLYQTEKFTKVPYESNFIESIIFGCRMEDSIKKFVIENMPADIKFKQAIVGKSSIKIVDYDDR